MVSLLVVEARPSVGRAFIADGITFSIEVLAKEINELMFNGEIVREECGIIIPNPFNEEGARIIEKVFHNDPGNESYGASDGESVFISPELLRFPEKQCIISVTRILTHELAHVLEYQRTGELSGHGEPFRKIVNEADTRLMMPPTPEQYVDGWPRYPIPLYASLRSELNKNRAIAEAYLSSGGKRPEDRCSVLLARGEVGGGLEKVEALFKTHG